MEGIGAFGKMPSLGDFFRVNAAPSFMEPWDAWLQQGLIATQHALGPRWQDCYMSAPIWRFTLSAELAGPSAIQGVLMPSVDKVGRMFPLTLMVPLSTVSDLSAAHHDATDFFATLEDIALETLDGDLSRADLKHKLVSITALRPKPTKTLTTAPIRPQSIWSAELEQGPLMMTCKGLPTTTEICGLFDLDNSVWKTSATLPGAIL